MKTGMSSVLLWVSVFMCLAACSVKEDRGCCPCCIMFDLSGAGDVSDSLHLSLASAGGFLFNAVLPVTEESPDYVVEVPKGQYLSNVFFGDEELFSDSRGIVIPEGGQCPPVYMYSERIDASGEYYESRPVLSKNYCLARMRLVCEDASSLDFSLRIRGNVNGYDLCGLPADGVFSFSPEIGQAGWCEVRLPRQKDASLLLDIIDGENVLRSFSLGRIIIESGYDWSARDLDDIELTVDYSRTEVSFIVDDWEKEFTFDITI